MNKFNNFYKSIVNEAYEDDIFAEVYPVRIDGLLKTIRVFLAGRVGVKRATKIVQIVKNAVALNDTDLDDVLSISNQKQKQVTPEG